MSLAGRTILDAKDAYTRATFQALADAILPPVIRRTEEGGAEWIPGAVQLWADRFASGELDFSQFIPAGAGPIEPLSRASARLLDAAARQLVRRGLMQDTENPWTFPGGGLFSALSRTDRLRALTLLDRLEIPLDTLPFPFTNNPPMIQVIVNSFYQLTLFGYYSEWFGYGTTRLAPPNDRRLEAFPPSWRLVGYPGPSFGYRDLRGFLLKYPHKQGDDLHE